MTKCRTQYLELQNFANPPTWELQSPPTQIACAPRTEQPLGNPPEPRSSDLLYPRLQFKHVRFEVGGDLMSLVVKCQPAVHKRQQLKKNISIVK